MGYVYVAKCCSCNHEFSADEGDGFFFHLLHCEKCGLSQTLEFDKIGKMHYDYIRGLLGHDSANVPDEYRDKSGNGVVTRISEEDYQDHVEKIGGKCECGGNFRMLAPVRCPQCKSTDIESTGKVIMHYD